MINRSPSRVQRSVLSWATGMGGTLATALAGLVATPLLLRWLGTSPFGAWEVVGEWLGYLGLTQLALGPIALTVLLLRTHVEGRERDFVATARWGLRAYARACAWALPGVLLLALLAPRLMRAHNGLARSLSLAVGIAALAALAIEPLFALCRAVLETRQRSYWMRLAMTAQGLLIIALSLWWAHRGWGIVGMAAATAVGVAVGATLCVLLTRRYLRGWSRTPAAEIPSRTAWRLNWPIVAAALGNQINLFTDNTVVAAVLGLPAVTQFFLTQRAITVASAQVADIGSVSWAALGELRVAKPRDFQERLLELTASITGIAIVVAATVAAYDRAFLGVWVPHQPNAYGGAALALWTAVGCALFAPIRLFGCILDTQGDTRLRLGVSSLGAALNLGLSLLLARRLGLAGVAAGTAIAFAVTDAWYLPRLLVRRYGVSAGALTAALGGGTLRGMAFAAPLWLLVHSAGLEPHGWGPLLLHVVVVGCVACAYIWIAVLRLSDRDAWRARFRAAVAG